MGLVSQLKWFFHINPDGNAIPQLPVQQQQNTPPSPVFNISLSNAEREDPPKFVRKYRATIIRGITINVTCRTTMFGDRDISGELSQSISKWIFFNPNDIAEKILDPQLVPIVTDFVKVVSAMDREFVKTGCESFVDIKGRKWIAA